MSSGGPFPTQDAEFHLFINRAIPYLNVPANKSRLVTSTTAISTLADVTAKLGIGFPPPPDSWNDVYPKAMVKDGDDTISVGKKTKLRDEIEDGIMVIYGDIPRSELTLPDMNILNKHLRADKLSQVGTPKNAPSVAVYKYEHLALTIRIHDPAHPDTNAKPDGVDAIEIEIAFQSMDDRMAAIIKNNTDVAKTVETGDVKYIPPVIFPQESDFRHFASTGKFIYKMPFTESQVGGTVWIRVRYVNSRKQPGPWSEIISAVVS